MTFLYSDSLQKHMAIYMDNIKIQENNDARQLLENKIVREAELMNLSQNEIFNKLEQLNNSLLNNSLLNNQYINSEMDKKIETPELMNYDADISSSYTPKSKTPRRKSKVTESKRIQITPDIISSTKKKLKNIKFEEEVKSKAVAKSSESESPFIQELKQSISDRESGKNKKHIGTLSKEARAIWVANNPENTKWPYGVGNLKRSEINEIFKKYGKK